MTHCLKKSPVSREIRPGKVLVLLLIMLPVLFGIMGLIIDGGALMIAGRHAQNVADAAATAAATQLRLGNPSSLATTAAQNSVTVVNNQPSAVVTANIPPTSGPYAGMSQYAQVHVQQPVSMSFMPVLTGTRTETVAADSVAGVEDSTQGAAIVVLDPDPAQFSLAPLPITLGLSLPSLYAGFEILGLGTATVNAAVQVNTRWGGVDEKGAKVGDAPPPPYAVGCNPIISTTKLLCTDLRVVGGVDSPNNYQNTQSGQPNPLHANRLAVADPLISLPAPTTSSDSKNVSTTNYGGVTVVSLPLLPLVTLNPGVYDYINVVSGKVVFNPGIYIIRGVNPGGLPSLYLIAGQIQANGVMFYLTNSSGYSATSGLPDSTDGSTEPAAPTVGNLLPSAIVNVGLTSSSFSPLNSPGSPFNGMMFYQRRADRQPIVIIQESLIGGGTLQGIVYAKWGHVLLAGMGTYNAQFVAGTMRIVTLLNVNIQPTSLFPPATDVYLVQ